MAMTSRVVLHLQVSARMQDVHPEIQILLDQQLVSEHILTTDVTNIHLDRHLALGDHSLILRFQNKVYKPYPADTDMAVLLHQVTVQHLPDNFVYVGRYVPQYPEPWRSEQLFQGSPLPDQLMSDYLGWNGDWQLNFSTPIYPWIHRSLNLGWLL